MSLPNKMAAMAAPIVGLALLFAVPASAQSTTESLKASANSASATSGAMAQAHMAGTQRSSTKMHAPGVTGNSTAAAKTANTVK